MVRGAGYLVLIQMSNQKSFAEKNEKKRKKLKHKPSFYCLKHTLNTKSIQDTAYKYNGGRARNHTKRYEGFTAFKSKGVQCSR